FTQAFALGFIVAGDHDAVAGSSDIQFIAELADFAAEALDRFDPKMADRFDGSRGQRGYLHARKPQQLSKYSRQGEEAARIRDALQVMLTLFVQILGLDQQGPGVWRKVIADMPAKRNRAGTVALGVGFLQSRAQEFNGVELVKAALGVRREL